MELRIDPARVPKCRLYTGAEIPAIGLGTFASDKYGPDAVAQAVKGAVAAGYRLIDCAAVYQNEKQIGEALSQLFSSGIVIRDELFSTSKVWNDRHRHVREACETSLKDLGLDTLDLYFVHWPFPNYHPPGCGGDTRSPDARPFSVDEFMDTWRQCEALVDDHLVRHIGMSNMTIEKLEAVLPLCRIKPAAIEMELHPSFQQPKLFDCVRSKDILPIGFCPLGSPSRPERDRTPEDVADMQMPVIQEIAEAHGVHPVLVCLKWAVQRGRCRFPFL